MTAQGIPRDDSHLCSRRSWSSAGAAVAGTPQISFSARSNSSACASVAVAIASSVSFKQDVGYSFASNGQHSEGEIASRTDGSLAGSSSQSTRVPSGMLTGARNRSGDRTHGQSVCAARLASAGHDRDCRRTRPQIAHHHHISPQVTITRKGHAFDGQNLAAIGSLSRRGVLFVLVSLPDGSRSLIPAKWTDWEGNGFEDSVSSDHSTAANHLARLYDLLHLRKVLDAVQSRLDQRALPVERPDATETCAFQSSQSAAGDLDPSSRIDRLGRHRRDLAPDSVGSSCAPHRPDAGCRAREGGTR